MFQPVTEVLSDPLSPSSTFSSAGGRVAPPWPFRSPALGDAGSLTPNSPVLTGVPAVAADTVSELAADGVPEMAPDEGPDRPPLGRRFGATGSGAL